MTSLDDFKIIERLGDGAYSTVFKVKRNEDNLIDIGVDYRSAKYQVYALKKVNIFDLSEKERENALNEVRILASCQNVNVISYKEAFIDKESNSLGIIMEYANNKDLYARIVEYTKK